MNTLPRGLLVGVLFLSSLACQDQDSMQPSEDYGDIYEKNGNSFIVQEIHHPTGWGQQNCIMCHHLQRIHQVDRIRAIDVDLVAIRQKIEEGKLSSCMACHGSNGADED